METEAVMETETKTECELIVGSRRSAVGCSGCGSGRSVLRRGAAALGLILKSSRWTVMPTPALRSGLLMVRLVSGRLWQFDDVLIL